MIQKIIKVLTEILEDEFTGVEVYSTDIEAGYKSPCFFIMCNSVKTEKLSSKIDTLYINLDVLYACEDRKINQKECFEISEKLRNIFLEKPIKIDDNVAFQIFENSIDIEDNYISITFNIEMNLIKDIEEDLSYMEDVSMN